MRLFLLSIVSIAFALTASGQSALDNLSANDHIKGERLPAFVDSLRKAILHDTLLYQRSDLKHTAIGTINTKVYSKLYLINNRYAYKLDVIDPKQVQEFVSEFLNVDRIQEIVLLDGHIAQSYFGSHASNGAVYIQLKEQTAFNPKVAGLANARKKVSNNFNQRRKGELFIRE